MVPDSRAVVFLYKVEIMSNFHLKLLQMTIAPHFLVWAPANRAVCVDEIQRVPPEKAIMKGKRHRRGKLLGASYQSLASYVRARALTSLLDIISSAVWRSGLVSVCCHPPLKP